MRLSAEGKQYAQLRRPVRRLGRHADGAVQFESHAAMQRPLQLRNELDLILRSFECDIDPQGRRDALEVFECELARLHHLLGSVILRREPEGERAPGEAADDTGAELQLPML